MTLPADQVGEAGRKRLISDQALQKECARPHEQEHQRHAEELRPVGAQQGPALLAGDQRHHAPDEDGDRRIERRHHEARAEQRDDKPARLPRIMPIEGRETRRRRRFGRQRRRLQQALEETKRRHCHADVFCNTLSSNPAIIWNVTSSWSPFARRAGSVTRAWYTIPGALERW